MSAPVECTGVSATWCPRHGDCNCEERTDGIGRTFTDAGCPLHGHGSMHPDAPAPWRFDVPVVPAHVTAFKVGNGDVWVRLEPDLWGNWWHVGHVGGARWSTRSIFANYPLVECEDPRSTRAGVEIGETP